MPNPTSSTTLQRPDLGTLVYEYLSQGPNMGFIGAQILPVFETPEQSADYPVIPIETSLKDPATIKRKARGAYVRDDYEFETGTYACEEYGFESPVDDTEARLYQRYFDAEAVAVERAAAIMMRAHEKRVAAMVFNPSNITNTGSVTYEWNNASSCTPRADVLDAKTTLRNATGIQPNALAISLKVFENLLKASEILSAMQYSAPLQAMGMTEQIDFLRRYFAIDVLLVSGSQKDSAGKGLSTTLADIWDDEYALLFKAPGNPRNLREPCLGRTFLWIGDSPQMITTEQYRDETVRSNIYRVRQHTDEAFVFTGAAYLLSNITS